MKTLYLMFVPEGRPLPKGDALQGFSQRVKRFDVVLPTPDTRLTWKNLSDASYLIIREKPHKDASSSTKRPNSESQPVVDPEVRSKHFWHWVSIFPKGTGYHSFLYEIGSVSTYQPPVVRFVLGYLQHASCNYFILAY